MSGVEAREAIRQLLPPHFPIVRQVRLQQSDAHIHTVIHERVNTPTRLTWEEVGSVERPVVNDTTGHG